ncbi:FecCD family ABC transporter permease [Pseudoclavibacter endophyticus]|uniref:FecCD family ABC transporter permease n=1 Tax=Pseudoclavibacter endophyticus TaxID=1778590 RepID=UPI0035717372
MHDRANPSPAGDDAPAEPRAQTGAPPSALPTAHGAPVSTDTRRDRGHGALRRADPLERPKPTPPRTKRGRAALLAIVLGALLVAGCLVSAMIGQLYIPPNEVLGFVLHSVGIDWIAGPSHEFGSAALTEVRFPRIVLTLLVGAALAVAGTLMQGIFGNPLAEPGSVGVSSGAAVGASFSILFSLTFLGPFTTPAFAFVAGLITTFVVYALSRQGRRTEVITLILTGVAVNAVCGALIAFITFRAPTQAREQIVFWQMGSLNGSRWEQVALVAPLVVVGCLLAIGMGRQLDLLSLGEKAARHVGVNVERVRVLVMIYVALLVSAAVAFAGIIAFVGLVVPHIIRMIIGPAHRALLICSVLGGALLLTVADLAARTLVEYADLPIGMLTSMIGGPFFFYLIRRSRSKGGGWQ